MRLSADARTGICEYQTAVRSRRTDFKRDESLIFQQRINWFQKLNICIKINAAVIINCVQAGVVGHECVFSRFICLTYIFVTGYIEVAFGP